VLHDLIAAASLD